MRLDWFHARALLAAGPAMKPKPFVEWSSIPIVVLTAYELDAEERRRLNGSVETIIKKAGDTREVLLNQLRDFLCDYTAPRAMTMQEAIKKHANSR